MDPFQKSKPLNDEELTKLLTEMITAALGNKAKDVNIEQIVGIAKEMLKESKPEGITKKDIKDKSSEMTKTLEQTLVAATAVSMLMTHQQSTLHNLLDRHKTLTQEMKKLKPGTPEHEEKRLEVNQLKKGIKNVLKDINRMDPNAQRRDSFDKQLEKDAFFEELTNPNPELQKAMKDNKTLDAGQQNTLTLSLVNLFGMDPRVPGSGMSPVQCVIGNEMGIPDSYPAFTANEPLHALSDDIDTPNARTVEGSRGAMHELESMIFDQPDVKTPDPEPKMTVPDAGGILDKVFAALDTSKNDNVIDKVLDDNRHSLGHEPPTLKR